MPSAAPTPSRLPSAATIILMEANFVAGDQKAAIDAFARHRVVGLIGGHTIGFCQCVHKLVTFFEDECTTGR